MPGLAGPGQSGPQLGRSGPLTSLPGSELNLGQRPEGQVCRTMLSFSSTALILVLKYSNFN
jgi:hypothetical protein